MAKKFNFNIKVYYEDTDAGGVDYYANYLKFLERARSEAIYSLGFSNKGLILKNKDIISEAEVHLVAVDNKGKPTKIPDQLKRKLEN